MAEVSQRLLGSGAHRLSALLRNRRRHKDSFSMSSCEAIRGLSAPGGEKGSVGALSSPQQLRRKFSTFIPLTLARGRQRHGIAPCITRGAQQVQQQQHHLHILDLWSIARGYSSGNNSRVEVDPLYRSRTAYYDILDTTPNATQSQIKTAYYKQSFVFHPDKNPGSEEAARRFSEVSEAYSVLGNIDLRRKYDRGILSLSDIRNPGRPSSRAPGGPQHHHQQQQARHTASQQQFSQHRGKTMFDFDAFYQAHYGEQLERERQARARKEWYKARDKQRLQELKSGERWMDLLGWVLLVMGAVLLVSLR
ncbi:hypothetical protein CRUP_037498 [Coryphaenoides rupestris]|nr:hypothetical protein CRUP_037498 [Coryphaenoides rupestris]